MILTMIEVWTSTKPRGGLFSYPFTPSREPPVHMALVGLKQATDPDALALHYSLGHLNWRAIKQMISAGLLKRLIRGLKKKLLSIDEITCEGCLLGKATFRKLPKSSTSRPQAAAKTPFGMVSFDHCGPFTQQVNGMKYFSVALCHFSGATVVRLTASTCSKTSIDFVEEVHTIAKDLNGHRVCAPSELMKVLIGLPIQ